MVVLSVFERGVLGFILKHTRGLIYVFGFESASLGRWWVAIHELHIKVTGRAGGLLPLQTDEAIQRNVKNRSCKPIFTI